MAGLKWDIPPATVFEALAADYRRAIEAGIYAIAQYYAPQIENYMKQHAVWVDRTGAARSGLYTEVEQMVGVMTQITLAHSMEYGTYLEGWDPVNQREMQNAGQFAIIAPSLDIFGPRVFADIRRMLT